MWHLTIIADGVKFERPCTPAELTAVGVELKKREDSLRTLSSLKIFARAPNGITHIITNRRASQ